MVAQLSSVMHQDLIHHPYDDPSTSRLHEVFDIAFQPSENEGTGIPACPHLVQTYLLAN